MGRFERFLSLWVALAILVGVLLGRLAPGLVTFAARLEVANINLVVAVLIWSMIYPMMLAIEPGCIRAVGRRPKGLVLTLVDAAAATPPWGQPAASPSPASTRGTTRGRRPAAGASTPW